MLNFKLISLNMTDVLQGEIPEADKLLAETDKARSIGKIRLLGLPQTKRSIRVAIEEGRIDGILKEYISYGKQIKWETIPASPIKRAEIAEAIEAAMATQDRLGPAEKLAIRNAALEYRMLKNQSFFRFSQAEIDELVREGILPIPAEKLRDFEIAAKFLAEASEDKYRFDVNDPLSKAALFVDKFLQDYNLFSDRSINSEMEELEHIISRYFEKKKIHPISYGKSALAILAKIKEALGLND